MDGGMVENPAEKGRERGPFEREFEKISYVRDLLLKKEIVRPLNVSNLQISGIELEGDTQNGEIVIVGAVPGETQDRLLQGQKVESDYCASVTDGRCVRLDFHGQTRKTNRGVLVEGLAFKGGGRTQSFEPRFLGTPFGGVLENKSQFGSNLGTGDMVGTGDYQHAEIEKELLLDNLHSGARVDLPILSAKLEERWAGGHSGIIVNAYRTPFNFQHFERVLSGEVLAHKYLIMHGLSVWKREGLIDEDRLNSIFEPSPVSAAQRIEQQSKLIRFYVENGARIAGGDLALIHKQRSLGNRNPQNMGDDFSHRDVADYQVIQGFDIGRFFSPHEKFEDILGDIGNIRRLLNRLTPGALTI